MTDRAATVHRHATRLTSALLAVLGIVMLVVTLSNGGGPFSVGVLFGVVLTGAGAARLWLTRDEERNG